MAIISSFGSLRALTSPISPSASTLWPVPVRVGDGLFGDYAAIYATQPNIRICVDFLARNVAQLGLHFYRRVSELDRVRITDHPINQTIAHPNPGTTRYRLIEALMQDLGVYFSAFWLKIRTRDQLGLVRLPPAEVATVGITAPTSFIWYPPNGGPITFPASEIVAFGGYDPRNTSFGISPIETLRQILAEDAAANEYRGAFWLNSARVSGVIERPASAPNWTPQQRLDFRTDWHTAHSGTNAGGTAILEDGMTWKDTPAQTFADSEYLNARKLSREESARAYHIPLPMVGILDHATFSNVKEQHKQLYQDSLGPWLSMIEGEIDRQVLPEFPDTFAMYPEFNIAEKLQGSFEEQATSIRVLVGRPIMTANEGRSRLNLPRVDDPTADTLAQPLNMSNPGGSRLTGGDGADPGLNGAALDQIDRTQWAAVIRAEWARQWARLRKAPAAERARAFDFERYTTELAHKLTPLYTAAGIDEWGLAMFAAARINRDTLALLAAQKPAFGPDRPVPEPDEVAA